MRIIRGETVWLLSTHDSGLGTTSVMLEIMRILLENKPICQVTADILESAVTAMPAPNSSSPKMLLRHDPDVPVTPQQGAPSTMD